MQFKHGMLGACIIVLSLLIGSAGSLLLNVDKTEEATTTYNYVTDITGLFDVSDEPQYIDFNPASNYTGYMPDPVTYVNSGGWFKHYKAIDNGTISITANGINVNGLDYDLWTDAYGPLLVSSRYYVTYQSNGGMHYYGTNGDYAINSLNISINNARETVTTDQGDMAFIPDCPVIIYWPFDDYDYIKKSNQSQWYYKDLSDFITIGSITTVSGTASDNDYFVGVGTSDYYLIPNGGSHPTRTSGLSANDVTDIDTGVKRGTLQANSGVYIPPPDGGDYTLDATDIFGPRYVQADETLSLVYTPSLTANNYRIIKEYGAPAVGPSGSVNNSTDLPQVSTDYEKRGAIYTERVNGANTLSSQLVGFKVATLHSWLSSIMTISNYSSITLNFTYPGVNAPTYKGGFSTGYNDITESNPPYTSFGGVSRWQSITVNPDDLTFTYVNEYGTPSGGVYSLYNAYIIYGDCKQAETYLSGGSIGYGEYSTSLTVSYTSNVVTANQYEYMIPSQGVTTYNHNVIWDNDTGTTDYDNYNIDILVGFPIVNGVYNKDFTNNAHTFRLGIKGDNPNYDVIEIKSSPQGFKYYYKSNSGTLYASGTLGKFDAVLISLIRDDSDNIKANLYGVTSFTDYFSISYPTEPNKKLTLDKKSDLDQLYFNTDSDATGGLYWSVYNTNLFMDTYGAVMVDPSIDLADYWADMSAYRYAFQSFAVYGDTVTINNVTYQIEDEQITIDNKKYHFDNLYLSFSEQGKTSITFRDVNRTVDLGDTVDKVVSFGGTWYFTTGLYEGVQSVQSVYNWDISDPLANLDMVTMVLFTLGVMAVLCLLFVITKTSFSLMDKLVVAFGALLLFIILGVVY